MNTASRYQDMSKSELLEVKAEVDQALEQKKFVSGLDIGQGFANSIKGKKPVITKELLEQMMNEAAH
jgi:hypothetical protein